jgi:hypothetical protein
MFPKDCGLPSYKPATLTNLKSRFLLDKDDFEAAVFMQERVKDAVAHMVSTSFLTRDFQRIRTFLLTHFADHHHAHLRRVSADAEWH